jgi:predicted kinase
VPDSVIGSPETILVLVRGNSGSGKTSVAREVRRRHGRGCALIEQDYLRRIVLRERDDPSSLNVAPGFIVHSVAYALDHGYHVILEGILYSPRYGGLLHDLLDRHAGRSHVFYLDVSYEETVRRHAMRPQAADFTPEEMRSWYAPRDLLGRPGEHVVPESSSMHDTVALITATAGLRTTDPELSL